MRDTEDILPDKEEHADICWIPLQPLRELKTKTHVQTQQKLKCAHFTQRE